MNIQELKQVAETQRCYNCESKARERLKLVMEFDDNAKYYRIYFCKECIWDLLELKYKPEAFPKFLGKEK